MLLVALTTVIYQLIIEIRKLPNTIQKTHFKSIDQKMNYVSKEVKKIRDDLGMD